MFFKLHVKSVITFYNINIKNYEDVADKYIDACAVLGRLEEETSTCFAE